jgi:hypothetical protein
MNNKRILERIAKIGLVALLVGYGIYQTAYGIMIPTALQRTATDASYKYGFIQGKSEWGSCSDADGDCQTGLTDCQSPSYTVYNYMLCFQT